MEGVLWEIHYNDLQHPKDELVRRDSFSNKLGTMAATKAGALTALLIVKLISA